MSALIRKTICKKLATLINSPSIYYELEILRHKPYIDERLKGKSVIQWRINANKYDPELLRSITRLDFDKRIVNSVYYVRAENPNSQKDRIEFVLEEDALITSTLLEKKNELTSKIDDQNDHYQFQQPDEEKHMIFEFSSPNIAKPFHVGHLRSTIIGNALSNMHQQLGYNVTKINYLGDWGKQFGLLQMGIDMLEMSDEEIRKEPIASLYKAYVHANQVAAIDETVSDKAKQIFSDMEWSHTSKDYQQRWQQYRLYTIEELERIYKRLGVEFDVYDWESQYSQKRIVPIIAQLEAKNLLYYERANKNGDNDHSSTVSGLRKMISLEDGKRSVPLCRSDGSTLYLIRDVAALLDRWSRYKFDQHFYVVESGQSDHFNDCFEIASKLCNQLDETRLNHVKFGRIHGMSTRKGQAVFLDDLLNEARDRMHLKQLRSPTTKVKIDPDEIKDCPLSSYPTETADILGITAVIVNDLKQRRQRDYFFNWEKALQMNGDSGIKLQYTHCRLHSLLQQNSHLLDNNELVWMNGDELQEPEAQTLIYEIARFPQVVWRSSQQLEPCILVNYLFTLSNATSRALKRLPVKKEKDRVKQLHRLMLFNMSKKVLKRGMRILGLKPLNAM